MRTPGVTRRHVRGYAEISYGVRKIEKKKTVINTE
jgi:hypothetical protein